MTTDEHTVTHLIQRLRASDPRAAQELWLRFFDRMVAAARRRLASSARRVADEEDAAVIAFAVFQQGLQRGRFPDLNNRDDLWSLLLTLTARAVAGQVRYEGRQKRAGTDSLHGDPPDHVAGPDEEAAFADELAHAIEQLKDEEVRAVALARLEGCTIDEIAERLKCASVTVRRRLNLIRQTWEYWLEE